MAIAGKTVLVTGASRGIGRALVEEALARGAARVYAWTAPAAGVPRRARHATDPGRHQSGAGAGGRRPGRVAGHPHQQRRVFLFDDLSDRASLEDHLAVNLYGTYDVTQAFLPALTRSGGAIVTIGSVAALAPIPLTPAYSLSKAAAFNLAQSLRILLARQGVRVHAVLSGPVDPTWSGTWTSPSPHRIRLPGRSSTASTTARRTSSRTSSPRLWPKAGAPASPKHSNARTRRSWAQRPSRSERGRDGGERRAGGQVS